MPNFHVILVHFPVAVLSLYVVLEFLKFQKLENISGWQNIKNFLLIIGALSAIPATLSGLAIHDAWERGGLRDVVKVHELVALFTTAYFFGLATARVIVLWAKHNATKFSSGFLSLLLNFSKFFSDSSFTLLFAVIGLGLILLTATLGGIIAFGPNIDPFTKFLNDLLF